MEFLAIADLQSRTNAAVIAMQPLIKSYAYKASQRAHVLNIPIDMDDLIQELSMACVRCVERYNPEFGWTFEAFLRGAFHNEISALFRRNEQGLKHGFFNVSSHRYADGEEGDSLFDGIDSGWASPDQELEAQDLHVYLVRRLKPEPLAFYRLLIDPPTEVMDQIRRFNQGVMETREAGGTGVRLAMISDLANTDWAVILDLSPSTIAGLMRQIEATIESYNRRG